MSWDCKKQEDDLSLLSSKGARDALDLAAIPEWRSLLPSRLRLVSEDTCAASLKRKWYASEERTVKLALEAFHNLARRRQEYFASLKSCQRQGDVQIVAKSDASDCRWKKQLLIGHSSETFGGFGLFTAEPIRKGEVVAEMAAVRGDDFILLNEKEVRKCLRALDAKKQKQFASWSLLSDEWAAAAQLCVSELAMSCFINHSANPNVVHDTADGIFWRFVADRDIGAFQQLTHDYCSEMDDTSMDWYNQIFSAMHFKGLHRVVGGVFAPAHGRRKVISKL